MNIIGRYSGVRLFQGGNRFSPSMVLDHKNQKLYAHGKDQWYKDKITGLYYPIIQGSSFDYFYNPTWPKMLGPENISSVSVIGTGDISFNNNLTVGSAGNAMAVLVTPDVNVTLTDYYVYLTSFTGTPADLNQYIYLGSRTSVGSSTGTTRTWSPVANSWNRWSSINQAMSAGSFYYIITGDADGSGSNFARARHTQGTPGAMLSTYRPFMGARTAGDGFNASITTTPTSGIMYGAVIFSTGYGYGWPFASSSSASNNTNQKGQYYGNFPCDMYLYGVVWGTGSSANISGVSVWLNSRGPSGVADYSSAAVGQPFTVGSNGCALFNKDATTLKFPLLSANVPCRITLTYSGATTSAPSAWYLGTGSDDTLKLAMPGGGDCYYTEQSGSSWVDATDGFACITLILDDIAPPGVVTNIGQRTFPVIPEERRYPIY